MVRKYLFFDKEFKFLVQNVHTLKQSMFEASEALQKTKGTKQIKTMAFHQYS